MCHIESLKQRKQSVLVALEHGKYFLSIVNTPLTFAERNCTNNLNTSPPMGYPSHHLWSLSLMLLELVNFIMVSYSSLMFPSVHYVSCYVFKGSQTSVGYSSNIPGQSFQLSLCQYIVLDLIALPNYISLLISFSCHLMWDALLPSFSWICSYQRQIII